MGSPLPHALLALLALVQRPLASLASPTPSAPPATLASPPPPAASAAAPTAAAITTAWTPLSSAGDLAPTTRAPKVLNFFPVPIDEECPANDGRRSGVCLNTYECRIQGGTSFGSCAMGLGVCCVFAATCGEKAFNNVTYFTSPNFPALHRGTGACELAVERIAPEISQLRLDFQHFALGQPNRKTGVCDSDIFIISGGPGPDVRICGTNHGQHLYYDIDTVQEPIKIIINMSQENIDRMWEVKITQMEFQQRAPSGCMQYYREKSGIIQTMNFAVNGRHLANQDYKICMRQEIGMCSIAYEPCDDNSFKIGPPESQTQAGGSGGGGGGGGGGGLPIQNDPISSGDGPVDDPDPGISLVTYSNSLRMAASRECNDRVVMPCDSLEEFIMSKRGSPMMCDLLHCGTSFCQPGDNPCRIESSTTPFNIHVQFGPAIREESPEDNLGMCLRYEQLPCTA